MTKEEISDSVKLFITEEMKSTRHKLGNDLNEKIYHFDSQVDNIKDKISSYDKHTALQTQITQTMQKDINRLNDSVDKVIEKLDNLDKKFVSRDDYKIVIRLIWTFGVAFVLGMGSFIWSLIVETIKNG